MCNIGSKAIAYQFESKPFLMLAGTGGLLFLSKFTSENQCDPQRFLVVAAERSEGRISWILLVVSPFVRSAKPARKMT